MKTSGTPNCPHCSESIDLVTVTDVVKANRERGWTNFHQNYVRSYAAHGLFPKPWFAAASRRYWLRSDYEQWWEGRTKAKLKKAAQMAADATAELSDEEFALYLAEIDHMRKRRAPETDLQ